MDVIIQNILPLTSQILGFELVQKDGSDLPPFSAGSHIDVFLENGVIRQYSLANCSSETHRYLIGVLNDANSRGGSRYIHESLNVGDTLKISEPRNLFPIQASTQKAKLFAGGIGITPIYAMAHELSAQNIPFELHYFARSKSALAFATQLQEQFYGQIFFHVDDEPESKVDIQNILGEPQNSHHLYVCGPNGFMDFIIQSAENNAWNAEQIHKEYFVAVAQDTSNNGEFSLEIKSTGQRITVVQDQTVVQALQENGYCIPVSCEQGICGTCLIHVIEGEPDHRDMFLTEEEQAMNNQFTPCCSRSKSKILVLDL